jgi:hypothetical protein
MNGFKIDLDNWHLKSLPISKGVVFNEKDFQELCHIVCENLDQ